MNNLMKQIKRGNNIVNLLAKLNTKINKTIPATYDIEEYLDRKAHGMLGQVASVLRSAVNDTTLSIAQKQQLLVLVWDVYQTTGGTWIDWSGDGEGNICGFARNGSKRSWFIL